MVNILLSNTIPCDPSTPTPLPSATPLPLVPHVVVDAVSQAVTPSLQRQVGVGVVNVPLGARSVEVVVVTGNPTVSIGAGGAVILPAGMRLKWSVDEGGTAGDTFTAPYTFTGVAGSDFIVTTTRA